MSLFDVTEVEENNGTVIVPPGNYLVAITGAEMKKTKDFTGQYLNVKFQIREGEHEGKTVYTMFNTHNKSPKAVEIGQGQYKAMCIKAGREDLFALDDVNNLLGLQVVATLVVKSDAQYGDKNEVKSYHSEDETLPKGGTEFSPQDAGTGF